MFCPLAASPHKYFLFCSKMYQYENSWMDVKTVLDRYHLLWYGKGVIPVDSNYACSQRETVTAQSRMDVKRSPTWHFVPWVSYNTLFKMTIKKDFSIWEAFLWWFVKKKIKKFLKNAFRDSLPQNHKCLLCLFHIMLFFQSD